MENPEKMSPRRRINGKLAPSCGNWMSTTKKMKIRVRYNEEPGKDEPKPVNLFDRKSSLRESVLGTQY